MKKLLVLISVVLISFPGFTRDLGVSWLEVSHSRLDCKKIHIGYINARIVLANGEKKTVPISEINSYSLNGKLFHNLPLYKNGKPTGNTGFMELIKTSGGFSLYQFGMTDEFVTPNLQVRTNNYFLYKGDKLQQVLDQESLPNICKLFGLNCIY